MDVYKLRFLAAHNHWKLGNFGPAQTHFRAALKIDPDQIGVYVDMSRFYISFGKFSDARSMAEKGLKKFGKHYQLYNLLGRAQFGRKQYKASLALAIKSKQLMPNNYDAVFLEGINNYALKKYSKAAFLLNWAFSMNKKKAEAAYYLGVTQIALGDDALAAGDKKKAESHYNKGREALDTVIDLNSSFPGAQGSLAKVKSKLDAL